MDRHGMLLLCVAVAVQLHNVTGLQCRVCSDRNLLGNMLDPVLRALGVPNIIPKVSECNNTASVCVAQSYCTKRIDDYEMQQAGLSGKASFWSKQCDIPPGISVSVSPGQCVEYDKGYANGYFYRRRMCACNNADICNGGALLRPLGLLFPLITLLLI